MKKRLLAAAVTGAVMLSAGAQAQDTAAPEGYQLQQVLIMSRHNLRARWPITAACWNSPPPRPGRNGMCRAAS
ncbi:glucose-1-phosphatase [Klebsiella pneumoniae]|nr:glucose-1-phosphatase [Klebsiella pneumoniae]